MDADSAWDRLVAESGDDVDIATMVAQSNIEDAQKALDKAKKQTPKLVGTTEEKLAAAKAFKESVVKAQNDLAKWQDIADVPKRRASLQTDLQTELQGQQVTGKLPVSEEVGPTETTPVEEVAQIEETAPIEEQTKGNVSTMSQETDQVSDQVEEEKDVIEELRERNRVRNERDQRAGRPPRPSDYIEAIGKGDDKAMKAWEEEFNDYTQKLNADDLPDIESTIRQMQGHIDTIRSGNPKGYKDNSAYKAYSGIKKMLEKRRRELNKQSAEGNTRLSAMSGVGLVEDARTRTLGDKTRKMLDAMAKRLGLQVEFVDEIVTGKDEKGRNTYANADIVGNKVRIAWDKRDQALDFLLGHEFTHRMQDLSPEAYAEFVEATKQALGKEEWNKRINRMKSLYKQHDIAISEQGIIDEVVADYAGELVEERGVFDNFVERNKNNRGLLSAIADVLRSIKEFFTLGKQRKINNAIARLEALIESASEANVDKVDKAVNKAIEQSSKVRFSAQELQQIEDANAKFNEELIDFGEKKHVGLLHLGKPMKILQVSGVNVEEMTISPSVLYKHLKQHNLVTDDLLDLARAVQFPILVYKHGESHPNIVVVTELNVKGGKLSIALKLDENGEVVEVSNVSSVHSKDALTELSRLSLLEDNVLRNNLRWVEKEKVSDWLGLPYEEERQANPKLDSVAKIINEFENPTISEEKNEANSVKAQYSLQGAFYSNAHHAVEDIKQDKATPQQWIAMLKKNGGLKAGEDKWLGLEDWLNTQQGSVTKQDIIDYINANSIKIEEVEYRATSEALSSLQREFDVLTDEFAGNDEEAYQEMINRYGDDFEMAIWNDEVGRLHFNYGFENYADVFGDSRVINSTRLDYTTEGLTNKREIALTVPTIDPYNQSDDIHFGDAGDGRAVAWIRFGETTDEDGNRVLVIDEIQSKRHQDGREKGYRDSNHHEQFENARKAYANAAEAHSDFVAEMKAKYGDPMTVRGTAEERKEARKAWKMQWSVEELGKYDELTDKMHDARKVYDAISDRRSGVPSAPFEKNWQELAMKRMLRYATDFGFDKLAWTTGEQQAKRYDIGTSVNHIHVINSEEERYVSVSPNNGRIIELPTEPDSDVIVSGEYKDQRLQDVFGKELAEKILSVGIGEDVRLAGESLRIGGEGMKGFYDKMLPSFMNKYGKKWGVKVGEVTMPDLEEGYQTMHSVDVTDAMREDVRKGQPLFSLQGNSMTEEVESVLEDYTLNKDNVGDFEYALMQSIAGQSYSARPDYKVLDGVVVRVKGHTPDWDNFVNWETDKVESKKILNVTVGNYEDTDYRRNKEDYESFAEAHPETTAVNVDIEDGTSLTDALSQIHEALKAKGIDFEFAPDYSWTKWSEYTPEARYSLASDMARDAVMTALEGAGIDVEMATPEMVEDVLRARDGVQLSKRSEEREQTNRWIDEATALVSGKSIKEVRQERIRKERERKELAKEIYENVLSGNFNEVTLQKINQYIDETTPRNPYGRRLSQRLPQRVEREMYEKQRENAVDALYSRISESSVPANGRFSESGRREIESRKKEALKGWAIATGNWHTDLSAFTNQTEPIGVGTDSKVYISKDGQHVIKASKGKPYGKRFRPDIDNIPLFNSVFRNSAYEIVGYGEIDGEFVRILKQPIVDFANSTPLTEDERVEYMRSLGFEPLNKENTAFSNGEIVISDLQKSNIVKDKFGEIRVVDADAKLHAKDVGGNYEYLPVEYDLPSAEFHIAYHGSGAKFDEFDHSHMGEGEGAQAYGWGTYLTEVEGIAKCYAKAYDTSQTLGERDWEQLNENIADTLSEEIGIELPIEVGWTGDGFEVFERILRSNYDPNNVMKKEHYEALADYFNYDLDSYEGDYDEFWNEVEYDLIDVATKIAKRLEEEMETPKPMLYTVEIPDDNGSNYLDYDEEMSKKELNEVRNKLEAILAEGDYKGVEKELKRELDSVFVDGLTASDVYGNVSAYLGGDKQASEFFNEMGYVGIKYPANYRSGGNEDGKKNFVIFNDSDMKITDRVEFLQTPDGTVYGWTIGGKIFLTEQGMNAETPIHEYTHLWANAMRRNNEQGWESVKDLLRGTPMWDEVLADKNYSNIHDNEDLVASEVLSRYSGKENAKRLEDEAKRMIDEAKGIGAKADAVSLIDRVRRALQKFWDWVGKDLFGIKDFESVEQVTDRVLYDLMNQTNLNAEVSEGEGPFGKIYRQFKGKAKEAFDYLMKVKEGDALGVYNRKGIGDIDLVWGDKNGGLAHIISKHIGKGKSFANIEDAQNSISDIINNGGVIFENGDKVVISKNGKIVTLRKNFRVKGKKIADKNWILTAYNENAADNTSAISGINQGQAAPTTAISADKGNANSSDVQAKSGKGAQYSLQGNSMTEGGAKNC